MGTKHSFSILEVGGPYREPRESAFSYDYAVQRPNWPTAHLVRVKVSIPDELEYCKNKVLQITGGSPGQQLRVNQLLSRRIADHKLQIANEEGLFLERREVLIDPFTGPMAHLFLRLEKWLNDEKVSIRQDIKDKVGL